MHIKTIFKGKASSRLHRKLTQEYKKNSVGVTALFLAMGRTLHPESVFCLILSRRTCRLCFNAFLNNNWCLGMYCTHLCSALLFTRDLSSCIPLLPDPCVQSVFLCMLLSMFLPYSLLPSWKTKICYVYYAILVHFLLYKKSIKYTCRKMYCQKQVTFQDDSCIAACKVCSDVLFRCRPVCGKQQHRLMLVVLVTVMYSYA